MNIWLWKLTASCIHQCHRVLKTFFFLVNLEDKWWNILAETSHDVPVVNLFPSCQDPAKGESWWRSPNGQESETSGFLLDLYPIFTLDFMLFIFAFDQRFATILWPHSWVLNILFSSLCRTLALFCLTPSCSRLPLTLFRPLKQNPGTSLSGWTSANL